MPHVEITKFINRMLAYALTPSVMWGQFTIPAGYRTHLTNMIETSYPMFWQVDRAG